MAAWKIGGEMLSLILSEQNRTVSFINMYLGCKP